MGGDRLWEVSAYGKHNGKHKPGKHNESGFLLRLAPTNCPWVSVDKAKQTNQTAKMVHANIVRLQCLSIRKEYDVIQARRVSCFQFT